MKEKKIGVTKITIQMGDKEAVLTVEQAKELRDALNSLLGEKVIERVVEKDRHHYYPYYPYAHWSIYSGETKYQGGMVYGTTITTGNSQSYTISLNNANSGDPLPV